MANDTDEFKWQDEELVVIKAVQATAIYTNNDGNVVIRQEADGYLFQNDPFVVIPLIELQNVIDRLSRIRDDLYE